MIAQLVVLGRAKSETFCLNKRPVGRFSKKTWESEFRTNQEFILDQSLWQKNCQKSRFAHSELPAGEVVEDVLAEERIVGETGTLRPGKQFNTLKNITNIISKVRLETEVCLKYVIFV